MSIPKSNISTTKVVAVFIVLLIALGVIALPSFAPPLDQGLTLISPLNGNESFLFNNDGQEIHKWTHENMVGNAVYLLEDGTLLRTERLPKRSITYGGANGLLTQYDWDGNVVWSYTLNTENEITHHDVEALPNGNVLMMVWENIPSKQAIAQGMDPEYANKRKVVSYEKVIEVNPENDQIVWEWSSWDHIVQEKYPKKPNYAIVSENHQLIDLNYYQYSADADWMHGNSIDYNPELDQVLISIRAFDEIWIIDHSTTTQEAASHSGGDYGHGGDLLFRWGNPETYNMGTETNRTLYRQHDARWIEPGRPGAGNITVFSNGHDGHRAYSTVVEIDPQETDGLYERSDGKYVANTVWEFGHREDQRFYDDFISGAKRLPNGNTLVSSGASGFLREVNKQQDLLWHFDNPIYNYSARSDSESNQFFRAEKYPTNYSGFSGQDLSVKGLLADSD